MAQRYRSPTGNLVAYQQQGPHGRAMLWIADVDGSHARVALDVTQAKIDNPPRVAFPLANADIFWVIAWSPDARKIYFIVDGWGNSRALYVVDLSTNRVRFVNAAGALAVIDRCANPVHIGMLMVAEHTLYTPLNPLGDMWILLDDRGMRHGEIGPADENVDRFLAKTCGVGIAPPDPPDDVPARLRARALVCGNHIMKYEPRHFLDGTSLPLFRWTHTGHGALEPDGPLVLGLDATQEMVAKECP